MIGKKFKILYIAGSGRSGSTLLASLLGELEGFFNAGEASRHLFAYKFRPLPCGCGSELSTCSFWKNIVSFIPSPPAKKIARKFMRIRCYPFLISLFRTKKIQSNFNDLGKQLQEMYRQISLKANCGVIVDSSKTPDFAYILSQFSDVEIFVLHLVREPWGVVSSWRKPKDYLRSQSVVRVSLGWMVNNLMIELFRLKKIRYQRVFYEELTQHPKKTLRRIIKFMKVEDKSLDFIQNSHAFIHNQHILGSNPDKLKKEKKVLIHYRPWKLHWIENILVTMITFFLWIKYYFLTQRN